MKEKNKTKKIISTALVPAVIALICFTVAAVCGRTAMNKDKENPTAAVQTEATTEPTTQKPADVEVSFVAVGDNLMHMPLVDAYVSADGTRDYRPMYATMKPYIESADVAIIDLETLLAGEEFDYSGYPCFNGPWEDAEALIDAGFDVFTSATNHALDKGVDAIVEERRLFKKHPEVTHTGINDSAEEYNSIRYREVKGIKIAFLNYTYMTNGIPIPSDSPWCINSLTDKEKIKADVEKARKNADLIIVFPHWDSGVEYSNDINSVEREYTKLFSELGVDVVIGSHPHVIQPMEWITNEKTGKQMLVYYALGNFISHQTEPRCLVGAMAQFSVKRENGNVFVKENAKVMPIVTHYSYSGKNGGLQFSTYVYKEYTDSLASSQVVGGVTRSYVKETFERVYDEKYINWE